jgi:predicted PurR-regulated permease PerM
VARPPKVQDPPTVEPHVERPGPAEFRDPIVIRELQRATVWFGMALLIAGIIVLAHPLLLIIGGLIFAVLLDGGARLLGRYLPIGRGWRLAIVLLLGFGFIGWVGWFAGTTVAAQFEELRIVVTAQFEKLLGFAASVGVLPETAAQNAGAQLLGSVGRLTSAVGSAIGAVTSCILMMVIGIFVAIEPRIYDRSIAWMLPLRHRNRFYRIASHVGFTLRRLLAGRLAGMVIEGVFTFLMLAYVGQIFGWMIGIEIQPIPMAALLGLITGLLAFIPNIGAIISGILMVAVGFSAGPNEGLFAIFVYFFVQNVDGYLIIPYIARKTVDLAPALVLGMQLLMGALFGILGVLFADPILATLKVTLMDLSRERAEEEGEKPKKVKA